VNSPAKIIFDCKSSDNKYIMTNKTKTFDLNEFIIFNNEIIYFFKINPKISIIDISFEISEKRHNFQDLENIKLNYIQNKNDNEEINLNIKNELLLTLKIKIMEKFNKKEIFETIQEKLRESQVTWLKKNKVDKKVIKTGISIQERIKIFSGKDNNTKTKSTTQNKPGKLKVPLMFKNSNKKSTKKNLQYKVKNLDNTEETKIKESKENNTKEENVKKDEKIKDSKENKEINNHNENKNQIILKENQKNNEDINKSKVKEENKENKINKEKEENKVNKEKE